MCMHVFYTYNSSVYMPLHIYTYDMYTQFFLHNSTWTYSELGSNPTASLECLRGWPFIIHQDCSLFSTVNKVRVNVLN